MAAETLTLDALLQRLQRDGVRRTVTALRKPPVPSRLLQELSERAEIPAALEFVAAYPLSPSHLLETLARSTPATNVLALLATNPRTPPHLLIEFASHGDAAVRAHAAAHPQLAPRELLTLTEDPAAEVRRALAGNASLRLPHQAVLSADAEPGVRLLLATQTSLSPQVALALSADTSTVVRLHTIAAARVEEEILTGWAASDEEEVQLALLQREDLPRQARQFLVESPHAAVRRAALASTPPDDVHLLQIATYGELDERLWLAARVPLPRPLQRLLAQDEAGAVKAALAANPTLDADIARYFVDLADAAACAALAANPAIPADLVQELAATREPAVLAALAYRDGLDEELARFLVAHSTEFRRHWAMQARAIRGLDADTARALLADPLPRVRVLAVSGHAWRRADLYDLARDPSASVRIAALQHPHAPDELVMDRLNDPDPDVVQAAREEYDRRERAVHTAPPPAPAVKGASRPAPGRPVATDNVPTSRPASANAGSRARPESASGAPATPAAPLTTRAPAPSSDPGLFNKLKRLFWQ